MSKKENALLNESLTWAGKLFFAGIASYLGKKDGKETPQIPIKIRANEKELKALENVIKAYKEFQEEINRPNVTIEEVMEKLIKKNEAKEEFFLQTNKKWPL